MVRVVTRSQLTAQEYLAWEREQVDRHEFHRGDVFAMAGGSPRHNWLAARVQTAAMQAVGDRCFTFTSDQKVTFDQSRRYVYPDATLVCGTVELQPGTGDVVTNPTVLVEVLSATTEAYDRGLKWEGYQQLPSLTDYLLVAQHEVRIEHFRRAPDRGWFYAAYGPGERLVLSTGVELDVDTVYARAFDLPGD